MQRLPKLILANLVICQLGFGVARANASIPLFGKLVCNAENRSIEKVINGTPRQMAHKPLLKAHAKKISAARKKMSESSGSEKQKANKLWKKLRAQRAALLACLDGTPPVPTAPPGDGGNDGTQPTATPTATSTPQENQFDAGISLSRTSGVAPLAVFGDGIAETSGMTSNDYVNAEFLTTFDSNGTSNTSTESGFMSTHVYPNAGTYTVSMNVIDRNLRRAAAPNRTITVLDPEIVFMPPMGETYCFSTGSSPSNFSGCPTQEPSRWITTTSFSTALSYAGTNRRLLFRRGDAWSNNTTNFTNRTGPIHIGGFPNPATVNASKPILRSNATGYNTILNLSGSTDVRVTDFFVQGPWTQSTASLTDGISVASTTNVLLQHLRIEGTGNIAVYLGAGTTAGRYGTLADSEITNINQYGIFGSSDRFAISNSTLHRIYGIQHGIRIQDGTGTVICHNSILDIDSFSSITIRGNNTRTVVCDNIVSTIVSFNPQHEQAEEYVSHVLAERNTFQPSSNAAFLFQGIRVIARNVVIRNNIFSRTSTAVTMVTHPLVGASEDVAIYNNTYHNSNNLTADEHHLVTAVAGTRRVSLFNNVYYSNSTTQNGSAISFLAPLDQLTSDFNVIYAPNQGPNWDTVWNGVDYTLSQWQALGKDTHTLSSNPDFVSISPADPTYLRPRSGSPLLGSGVRVPLSRDFHLDDRIIGSGVDRGAIAGN